jgi:myo-inositol-1-phosphate synthase
MSIRIAFAGCGNVVSAFTQGLSRILNGYEAIGTLSELNSFYPLSEIEIVLAFDVHKDKVGKDISEAIFVSPNNTELVSPPKFLNAPVLKGCVLDGLDSAIAAHVPVDEKQQAVDVTVELKNKKVDVLVICLPTGSQQAAEFYTRAALDAGCAVVNGMPAKIARHPEIIAKAEQLGLPLIGDDVKSQIGATIMHRALTSLFPLRGAVLDRTLQLDWGGDMDFCNLCSSDRYESGKREGKTRSVIDMLPNKETVDVQISAVDYIPFLKNQKEAYFRLEGRIFGGVSVRVDMTMQVIDGYNSAGILIDAARIAKIAKDKKHAGVVLPASAFFCKNPLELLDDTVAKNELMAFVTC